jgi:WD40 repeat protein
MLDRRPSLSPEADWNFLFAALAYQFDLLDRSRLTQAWHAWTSQRVLPLPDLLVQRGWLTADDRTEVEKAMARKLKRHGEDPRACLLELIDPACCETLTRLSPLVAGGNGSPAEKHPLALGQVAGRVAKQVNGRWAVIARRVSSRTPLLLLNRRRLVQLTTAGVVVLLIGVAAAMWLVPLANESSKTNAQNSSPPPPAELAGIFEANPRLRRSLLGNQRYRVPEMGPARVAAPARVDPPNRNRPRSEAAIAKNYEDKIDAAREALNTGAVAQVRTALVQALPQHPDEHDPRGPEWYLLWRQYQGRERLLWGSEMLGPVSGLAFAHSGRLLASAARDARVRLWDPSAGIELRSYAIQPNTPSARVQVAFTHDDKLLACPRPNGDLAFFVVETGREARVLSDVLPGAPCFALSPDDYQIATAGRGANIKIWDSSSGKLLRELAGELAAIYDVAFSPAGDVLASVGSDESVRIWQVSTGKTLLSFKSSWSARAGNLRPLTFSPNGKFLAVACHGSEISVRDSASGEELGLLTGLEARVSGIAFSPDSKRIAGISSAGGLKIWSTTTYRELCSLQSGHLFSLAFSPDGLRLAAGGDDGTIRIWETSLPGPDEMVRRSAEELIEVLLAQHSDPLEVAELLQHDPRMDEPVRRAAIRLAGPRIAFRLNNHSWGLVARKPDATAEVCGRAAREAEQACNLVPGNGNYLGTLGVAQYRAKQYTKALATLLQSAEINKLRGVGDGQGHMLDGPRPSDLAFLAMSYARLNKHAEAKATLEELQELMQSTAWGQNLEAGSFLLEAQGLIRGQ